MPILASSSALTAGKTPSLDEVGPRLGGGRDLGGSDAERVMDCSDELSLRGEVGFDMG